MTVFEQQTAAVYVDYRLFSQVCGFISFRRNNVCVFLL